MVHVWQQGGQSWLLPCYHGCWRRASAIADAYEAAHPHRQLRRTEKQSMQQMLRGKNPRHRDDA
jgi:hypothetical protein